MRVDLSRLERGMRRVERATSRLAGGIVATGLFVGGVLLRINDFGAEAFQKPARHQGGRVFDRRRDNVEGRSESEEQPFDRRVGGFRAAAGEDNFVGLGADQ